MIRNKTAFIYGFGFVASAFFLCSCAVQKDVSKDNPKLITERLFETFNQHDAAALGAFYAEDGYVMSPEKCEPTVGPKAIAESYQKLFNEIPDVIDTIEEIVVEDNKAAVRFVASSEAGGFDLPIAAFLDIKDGLIIRDIVYFDTDIVLECDKGKN